MPRSGERERRKVYQTRLRQRQRTVPEGVRQVRLVLADRLGDAAYNQAQLMLLEPGDRVKVQSVHTKGASGAFGGQWMWVRVDVVDKFCDNSLHWRIIGTLETRPEGNKPYAQGDQVFFTGKYVFKVEKAPRRSPRSRSPRAPRAPRQAAEPAAARRSQSPRAPRAPRQAAAEEAPRAPRRSPRLRSQPRARGRQ